MSVAARVAIFQLLVMGGVGDGVVVIDHPNFIDPCSVFSLSGSSPTFSPLAQSPSFAPNILADVFQASFFPDSESPSFTAPHNSPPIFSTEGCCQ